LIDVSVKIHRQFRVGTFLSICVTRVFGRAFCTTNVAA